MESVVFQTSGILDLKAVTVFGCSAKPRTNSPIGYFGTGLKYALAVLAREGCKVTLFRGMDAPLELTTKTIDFRDTTLETIYLGEQELPFTTDLGKNWKLWQALRELESNTMDEGGSSFLTEDDEDVEAGYTKIIVECENFCEEYENLSDIFLDTECENISKQESIEIYKQPSEYLFYKGIRVYKLPKSSEFTFNIVRNMNLTEDRTLQYWFIAEKVIAQAVGSLEDYDILFGMLTNPGDFISTLDFQYDPAPLSTPFIQATLEAKQADELSNPSAHRLVKSLEEPDEELKEKYRDNLCNAIDQEDWDEAVNLIYNDLEESAIMLQEGLISLTTD